MKSKNNTGIALIVPENTQYEPWTNSFGEDGMGYIKYQTNPARYLAEERGEVYSSVIPEQQIEIAPLTTNQWLNHAAGDTTVLKIASDKQKAKRLGPIETLGVINAPIIRMSTAPGFERVVIDNESYWDRMSNKERKKMNRRLNKDERKLRQNMRQDARIEQAIAKKFREEYNPGNRAEIEQRFMDERDRIDLIRNLING